MARIVSEDMMERRPLYTVGNVNWYKFMKTSIEIHQKLKKKIELSCHPEISLLDIYPKKMKSYLKEKSAPLHSLQHDSL